MTYAVSLIGEWSCCHKGNDSMFSKTEIGLKAEIASLRPQQSMKSVYLWQLEPLQP